MPYKRVGKKIYSKGSGKWKLKQTAKTTVSAKKTLGLLYGLESGSLKPKNPKGSRPKRTVYRKSGIGRK